MKTMSQSKCSSTHSIYSVERNKAVAEALAFCKVLAVLEEQKKEAAMAKSVVKQ